MKNTIDLHTHVQIYIYIHSPQEYIYPNDLQRLLDPGAQAPHLSDGGQQGDDRHHEATQRGAPRKGDGHMSSRGRCQLGEKS